MISVLSGAILSLLCCVIRRICRAELLVTFHIVPQVVLCGNANQCTQPNLHVALQLPALQHSLATQPVTSTRSTLCCAALHRPVTSWNDRAMTQAPGWVELFRLQTSHQMVSTSLEFQCYYLHLPARPPPTCSSVEAVEVARVWRTKTVAREADNWAKSAKVILFGYVWRMQGSWMKWFLKSQRSELGLLCVTLNHLHPTCL